MPQCVNTALQYSDRVELPPLRGFRVTSARRRASVRPAAILVTLAVLITTASVVAGRACHTQPVDTSPIPRPTVFVPEPSPPVSPTVTPSPTASPSPVFAEFVAPRSTPTPSPLPFVEPRRRPPPTPTPRIAECVPYRWEAIEGMPRPGHIMIRIRATNRCRRELGIGDVGFEAVAWRDGSVQLTRRGYPLEVVRRGRSFDVAFDLPGSTTWYDSIEVFILE
jgi:hypothetical protein